MTGAAPPHRNWRAATCFLTALTVFYTLPFTHRKRDRIEFPFCKLPGDMQNPIELVSLISCKELGVCVAEC